MTDSVLVVEHLAGDRVIGQLTLNVEKTLNSLTREMVDVITDRLEAWADDANVVAVVIDGAGEKAFCAGGDVQALRNSCIETPGGPCEYAEHFFAREYRMNYLLLLQILAPVLTATKKRPKVPLAGEEDVGCTYRRSCLIVRHIPEGSIKQQG